MRFYIQAILLLLVSFASASEELATAGEAYEISEVFSESLSKENHDNKLVPNDSIDPALSAECEPLTTVAGCVNVISGDFFQIEKDLIGNIIEPLSFTRFYDSGNKSESLMGFGFGSHFPLWASEVEKGARHHYGLISEREGFLLLYRDKEAGPSKLCFIDPCLLKKGYTNLSRAAVGGHANFVNWRALFHTNQRSPKGEWIVQLGDGPKRTYGKYVKIDDDHRARMQFPTKKGYLLTKEVKPNQNKLLFSYRSMHGKPLLTQVESFNRKGAPLNKLTFHYGPERCIIEDAYGNRVDYHYEDKPRIYAERFDAGFAKRKFLLQTESTQKGLTRYEMTPLSWKICQIANSC